VRVGCDAVKRSTCRQSITTANEIADPK